MIALIAASLGDSVHNPLDGNFHLVRLAGLLLAHLVENDVHFLQPLPDFVGFGLEFQLHCHQILDLCHVAAQLKQEQFGFLVLSYVDVSRQWLR